MSEQQLSCSSSIGESMFSSSPHPQERACDEHKANWPPLGYARRRADVNLDRAIGKLADSLR